jgi:hypothetical protein
MNTGSRPPARPRSSDAALTSDRAQPLVESGLIDVAAGMISLASSLADSAIASIQTRISERGQKASMDDADFLRAAIFHGIAQNIIERVERRLKAEPQSHVTSGSHTASRDNR